MFDNANSEFSPSGYYYPYDIDDDNFHSEDCLSLGLGDFLIFFDLMILSIQSSFWMIKTKVYVLFGSIIIIQFGHCCMRIVQRIWNESCMGMLPFSVIPFPAYVIILDSILFDQTNQCTNR